MKVTDYIRKQITFFDGGMGTLLQKAGLGPGEAPENWNIDHPEEVISIQADYFRSGTNVITTNSFGANPIKYKENPKHTLEEVVRAAVENAKKARDIVENEGNKAAHFVAFDMSSTGKLLEPLGDLAFEEAVSAYKEVAAIAQDAGADLILVETMTDIYEAKAAILAAKEATKLPVFATVAFDEKGRMLTGSTPKEVVTVFEGLGVDALGVNCSLGPEQMGPIVDMFVEYASVPVIVNPNAGLPRVVDGVTTYDVTPDRFAELVCGFTKKGASAVGGCCGTTHAHIKGLTLACKDLPQTEPEEKQKAYVASATQTVCVNDGIVVGEAINPNNTPSLVQDIKDGDFDSIIDEGMDEQDEDYDVIGVNVYVEGTDECEIMKGAVTELQSMVKKPLMIDTKSPKALEAALRCINGKALVKISITDEKTVAEMLGICKKYGGVIILDEEITCAENRELVGKIAKKFEIKSKDLFF